MTNGMAEKVNSQSVYMKPRRHSAFPWVVCGLAALFYSYEYLLRIQPGVMTAELMSYYQINAGTFGVLTAIYYYAYTPMQLVVGGLMDRYGPRRLLTFACILCVMGAFLFGGSPYLLSASVGRFLVGFGSAFAFVGVLKLATIWLPSNRLGLVTGMASALGTIGAMTGTVAMTSMVNRLGWQDTVYISAFFGIFLVVLLWCVVRDEHDIDPECPTSLSAHDISYTKVWADFLVILKNPQIWLNGVVSCLLYLPTTVFAELWGKTYLEQVFGLTATESAYGVAILFLGFAIGAPLSGFISDFFRTRKIPIVVTSFATFFLFSVLFIYPGLSRWLIYSTLFCTGLMYSTHVLAFALAREISPASAAASAIAVTNMIVMLGGFLCQPLVGILLDVFCWQRSCGLHNYSMLDYRMALAVIPAGLLLAAVLSLFLKETHCRVLNDSEHE